MRRKMKATWRRRFDAALTVLMLGVTALALWVLVSPRLTAQPGGGEAQLPDGPVEVEGLLEKGRPDSPAAVIVFSDFQCPFCARFAGDELKKLERDVAESGLARVELAHFPLERIHPLARLSAEAVECARHQQLGWQLHDILFGLQGSTGLRTRADVDAAIASVSSSSSGEIMSCVTAGRENQKVSSQISLARTLGVFSTPTFIIGRREGSRFFPKKRLVGATSAGAIADELREISQAR